MHCQRSVDAISNVSVTGDVALRNWRFDHGHLGIALKALQVLDGIGSIVKALIVVEVERELGWDDREYRLYGFVQVVPGSSLELG